MGRASRTAADRADAESDISAFTSQQDNSGRFTADFNNELKDENCPESAGNIHNRNEKVILDRIQQLKDRTALEMLDNNWQWNRDRGQTWNG